MEEQHDPEKFRVGDRVRVVWEAESFANGWCNYWSDYMTRDIGSEFVVEKARGGFGYLLSGSMYCFPSQALELAEPKTNPELTDEMILEAIKGSVLSWIDPSREPK